SGIQPFSVMYTSTPAITSRVIAEAKRGIGSSKGMAAQVNLPSILFPQHFELARIGFRDRAGPRRDVLLDDLPEQVGLDGAVGEGGDVAALLFELGVGLRRQRRAVGAGLVDPGGKVMRGRRLDLE